LVYRQLIIYLSNLGNKYYFGTVFAIRIVETTTFIKEVFKNEFRRYSVGFDVLSAGIADDRAGPGILLRRTGPP
jgi:hypothetical protein